MLNRPDHVLDCHPTPKLPSAANNPGDAHLKWQEHLGQRSALATEHNPETQIHYTNSRFRRGTRRRLPATAYVCQKTFTRRTVLIQWLRPAVPVVPNRRSAHQHAW